MIAIDTNLLFDSEIASNSSDITACVFMMVMIVAIFVRDRNREIYAFFSSMILMFGGLCCRVLGMALQYSLHFDSVHTATEGMSPEGADMFMLSISFICIYLGLNQFFLQVTSYIQPKAKGTARQRRQYVAANIVVLAFAVALYYMTKQYNVLTFVVIAKLIEGLCRIIGQMGFLFRRGAFVIAIVYCLAMCGLSLVAPVMQFTGIAFATLYLVMYVDIYNHSEKELLKAKTELTENRLRLLNEQIGSHFIFNTLQSIEEMCEPDPSGAKEAIGTFARYLRGNIDNIADVDFVPFEKELEHTEQYLALEQMNGNHRFEINYDLGSTDFMIPPLVLQPIVENAIKHGVKRKGADSVSIATRVADGRVIITVHDNGIAESHFKAKSSSFRKSVAVENIRQRLRLQCDGILTVDSDEKGTTTTIEIPWHN